MCFCPKKMNVMEKLICLNMWSNPFQVEEGEGGKLGEGEKQENWPFFFSRRHLYALDWTKIDFFVRYGVGKSLKLVALHWFLLHNQKRVKEYLFTNSLKLVAQNAFKMIIFMKVHCTYLLACGSVMPENFSFWLYF